MEQLAILSIIKREMQRRHISASELSRGLKRKHSSVAGMLQRPTLQIQRLAEISEFMQYNFFREIAAQFPYKEPNFLETDEAAKLQSRIRELELEVSILRQTLKDLVSR